MESKEHVNPFIDVHKKAEALRKRAREEHEKDEALREKRLEAESDQLRLRDPKHPFPFANLEHPKGEYKNHGLGNARYNARPTTASTEPVDFHIDGPDSAYAGLFFFPLQKSNGVVGGHTSPLPCADVAN